MADDDTYDNEIHDDDDDVAVDDDDDVAVDDDDDGNEIDDDDDDDDGEIDDDIDANRIPAANARSVLEYLARSMVDEPDSVEVDVREGRGRAVSLSVHVAPGDMGRVIGKRGRVANSIRTVVRAAAVRDDVDVDVDFVD